MITIYQPASVGKPDLLNDSDLFNDHGDSLRIKVKMVVKLDPVHYLLNNHIA